MVDFSKLLFFISVVILGSSYASETILSDKAIFKIDSKIYYQSELLEIKKTLNCVQQNSSSDPLLPISGNFDLLVQTANWHSESEKQDGLDLLNKVILILKMNKFYQDKLSGQDLITSSCEVSDNKMYRSLVVIENFLKKKYRPDSFVILDNDYLRVQKENPTWNQNQIKRHLETLTSTNLAKEASELIQTINRRYQHEIYIK